MIVRVNVEATKVGVDSYSLSAFHVTWGILTERVTFMNLTEARFNIKETIKKEVSLPTSLVVFCF